MIITTATDMIIDIVACRCLEAVALEEQNETKTAKTAGHKRQGCCGWHSVLVWYGFAVVGVMLIMKLTTAAFAAEYAGLYLYA